MNDKQLEYITKRELAKIQTDIEADREYEKRVRRLYLTTRNEIQKNIDAAMFNFSNKEGISVQEAYKLVSRMDVQAYNDKAAKYVAEKNFSKRANDELRVFNAKMRISRLELLKREIGLEIVAMANKEEAMLQKKLDSAYMDELKRQSGILDISSKTQEKLMKSSKAIISSSYHNTTFSDRVWNNQKLLQYELNKGIQQSIMSGKNPKTWASDLKKVIEFEMLAKRASAAYVANRLAITETARVQVEAAVDSYAEMGFEQYIWIAEPTACNVCIPHHHKIFDIETAIIGIDLPPMHPFCRCSVAAYRERDY